MRQCQPLPNSVIDLAIASDIFADAPEGTLRDHPARPLLLADFVTRLEEVRQQGDMDVWHLGGKLTLESFGALGEMLRGAPSLGTALRKFTEAFPLVQSNSSLTLSVTEDKARLDYRVLDPGIWPRRGDSELTMGFLLSLLARFGVPRSAISHIGFEHQLDRQAHAVAQHMLCRTSFDRRDNYLVFPAQCLGFENPDARDRPKSDFDACWTAVRSMLQSRQRNCPVAEKVRQQVLSRLGKATLHQQEVACDLGMSERSLRRFLAQEGTSYKDLLEECRGTYAIALLLRTTLPLSEIAFSLGYSDQTAFSRAFSKFSGHPPRDLRNRGETETRADTVPL